MQGDPPHFYGLPFGILQRNTVPNQIASTLGKPENFKGELKVKILSLKPGHDGHVAYLKNQELVFSIESEKDSWPRYASITPSLYLRSLQYLETIPDVISISGWAKRFDPIRPTVDGGYFGEKLDTIVTRKQKIFGKEIDFFSSSHERSHLLCSYSMSPFPQGHPCYALVWEGNIGAFYHIDEKVNITKIGDVLEDPGRKYAFLYALADPNFPFGKNRNHFRFEDAGKLMALVSYGMEEIETKEEKELIDCILGKKSILLSVEKGDFDNNRYLNIGVESIEFKNFAKKFSNAIFRRFFDFAKKNLKKRLPLIISGGCGLNCDWNSAWKQSGFFEDVFVPPCTNDSGSAIGTAVDAMRHYTGNAKIKWSVYAGEEFVYDDADLDGIEIKTLDMSDVAEFLRERNVIAWAQGKYEIGPRALGNRSVLASPFTKEMHARLNSIKNREGFRPIAPICLESEIDTHFNNHGPSPHMLYFQTVKTDRLKAVTHVDGSTRLQSINELENVEMHSLLKEFKKLTGYGVLCNTSLNFKGTGFINRMSDLVRYVRETGIDGFVVGNKFYVVKKQESIR